MLPITADRDCCSPNRHRGRPLQLHNEEMAVCLRSIYPNLLELTPSFRYNEAYELSRRRSRFNVQGLIEKAVEVSGHGVTSCMLLAFVGTCWVGGVANSLGIRVMKYQEGEYNKVFLLTMDNGAEVVAKVPNLNAGPAHHTTASEVATMSYVGTISTVRA